MKRWLIGAWLMVAPVAVWAGDPALDAAINEIYAPYRIESDDLEASLPPWERPIFSRELQALVAQWREASPANEVDALSGADWLCQCQDWDASSFGVRIVESLVQDDRAEASVAIQEVPGEARMITFDLLREDGEWKINDIVASDFPSGLRQALRDAMSSKKHGK